MRVAWRRGQADASRTRGPGEELHVRIYEHERHLRSPGTRAGSRSPGLARAEGMGQLQARRSVRRPAGIRRSIEPEHQDDDFGNARAELEHESGVALDV